MSAKLKINDEKQKRDYGAKLDLEEYKRTKKMYKEMTYNIEMSWKKASYNASNKKTKEISGRVLASFGFQCLKKALKNKGIILASDADTNPDTDLVKEELKARLDPFVLLLFNAFKTYHNPIIV